MRLQHTLVFFATLLIFIQLIVAFLLFFNKYGFDATSLQVHFAGDVDQFIMPKTFSSLIKTTLSHIVAITLLGIFLMHLLDGSKKQKMIISSLFFTGVLFDLLANYLISYSLFFAYLKLFGFFTMMIGAFGAILLIAKSPQP